jgi:outer membrane protein assembly factor BamB
MSSRFPVLRRQFWQQHAALAASLAMVALSATAVADAVSAKQTTDDDLARSILQEAGVPGGLVVHLGCGDGRLTAALRVSEQYLVHGLDADPANVEKARQHVRSCGLYGPVSVDALSGRQLPYADNLVNLLVAGDLSNVPMSEVMRVLAPGGVALTLDSQLSTLDSHRKPWPEEIDEWTHWLHDPSGNAVGRDRVVGPPRRFQWAAGPLWSRHHNTVPGVSAMVSAGGRVFTIVDEGPPAMAGTTPDKWFLVARDAFNGVELWRKPIADWGWRAWSTIWNERFNQPNNVPKRLVAVDDRVYVTLGFNAQLTALDAATGAVVKQFDRTDFTDEILCQDGLLILSINDQPQGPGELKDEPPVKKCVVAIDAETGERLWTAENFVGNSTKTGPLERVTHLLLTALDNQVFVLDGDAVVSLDLATGRQLWRSPRPLSSDYTSRYHHRMSEMCTLVATDDVVLLCQLEPIQKRIGWRVIKARLQAYERRTGKKLWEYRCGNWGHFCVPDVFVAHGLVWVHDKETMSIVGLDQSDGTERRRLSTEKALDNGHHHRCYRNKATNRFLVTSYRGVEFVDWDSGDVDRNHWVRGTCRYGVMPCNGLLYSTPHPCDCYITSKLNGFYALAPEERTKDKGQRTKEGQRAKGKGQRAGEDERLEKGPAYGASGLQPSASSLRPSVSSLRSPSWPMYRHDHARTGCADGPAPGRFEVAWKTTLPGGRITAPVVADGKVLVASVDSHTVHALAVDGGGLQWRYAAAGRVDTPPTIWNGRAIFGCRSGWVVCLRMSDGALIWRFRAAPSERLVVAHGGLESAWPVHGSVLVRDGKAYLTAGRSSFLDGGITAYCLDAVTGNVIDQRAIAHPQDMPVDTGRNQNDDTGVLSDLIVGEGDGVYMRNTRLFGASEADAGWGQRVGATAGMLDDSWFNRTVWLVDGRDHGEMLVHDAGGVYAVRVHKSRGHGDYIVPGTDAYQIVSTNRTPTVPRRPGKPDKLNTTLWPRPKQTRWSQPVPIRVTAMAVGGRTLLCAGTPDALDPDEPWAAYRGRRGGMLLALATEDGTTSDEMKLDAAPVYDGMAVAGGHLYLSTVDGTLLCIGQR